MKPIEVFLLLLDRIPDHHRSHPNNLSGSPNSLKFNVSETSTNRVNVNQFYCSRTYIRIADLFFNVHIMNVNHAKFQKKFDGRLSSISLANNRLIDVTRLALTWVVWPNDEKLASTCLQI